MNDNEYSQQITQLAEHITELPTCELKYHLWLLVAALRGANNALNNQLAEAAIKFCEQSTHLLKASEQSSEKSQCLTHTRASLDQLIQISGIKQPSIQRQQYFLNVQGVLLGMMFAVIASGIGGVAGTGRAINRNENLLRYFFIGLATGFFLGLAAGYRIPKKLFKDPVVRQFKFALNGLEECFNFLARPHKSLTDEMLKIQQTYFCRPYDLTQFSQQIVHYEILTFKAQFFSPTLEGYVGHHACIKITIAGQKIPLEYSLGSSDIQAGKPSQVEVRKVTGAKIIEMIAFHHFLQQSHACNSRDILTKMKPGDRDCFNYINLLLLGTNQAVTQLKRFDTHDKFIGRNIVCFFITELGPFKTDELDFTQKTLSLK